MGVSQRVWPSPWNNIICALDRHDCTVLLFHASTPPPERSCLDVLPTQGHQDRDCSFVQDLSEFIPKSASLLCHRCPINLTKADWFRSERILCWNSLLPPSLAAPQYLPSVAQSLLQLTAKGNRKFSPGTASGKESSLPGVHFQFHHQFLTNYCPFWGNHSHLTPFPCRASVGTWEHNITYVNFTWPHGHEGNPRGSSFTWSSSSRDSSLPCHCDEAPDGEGTRCVLRHSDVPNVQALAEPESGEIAKCKPGNFPAAWESWASPASSPISHLQGFAGCSLAHQISVLPGKGLVWILTSWFPSFPIHQPRSEGSLLRMA